MIKWNKKLEDRAVADYDTRMKENVMLKKEIEELEHREYCLRQDAKGHSPSEVQEYRDEIREGLEQIKKLKECLDNEAGQSRMYEKKYKELKEELIKEKKECVELMEANKKLKEEKLELRKRCAGINIVSRLFAAEEENEKLKEQIKPMSREIVRELIGEYFLGERVSRNPEVSTSYTIYDWDSEEDTDDEDTDEEEE